MYFFQEIGRRLREANKPLMTEYDFYVLGFCTHLDATRGKLEIARLPHEFDTAVNRRVIRRLERDREIVQDNDFKSGVWQVLSASSASSAEEALSIIDPFCYVSHLSALQRHGLTNRAPLALHLTTLVQSLWGQRRREQMREEVPPEMLGTSFPVPHQTGHKAAVRRRPIEIHRTKYLRPSMRIRGTHIRVSTVGSTFVDTLDMPSLCGGMRHVIEIWKKHAARWLDEIVSSVNEVKQPIVKVRAGYLLDEVVGVRDRRVQEWVQFAQRGGSRKLNPDKTYGETWSEKWMLATNV